MNVDFSDAANSVSVVKVSADFGLVEKIEYMNILDRNFYYF